jgi:putative thiamine transport system ATP-binding protein
VSGALLLEGVSLALGARPLFRPLTLAIAAGEIVTLTGPSGAGKSSLLAFIGGTLPKAFRSFGRVLLDGQDLAGRPPETRRVGVLFQDDLLFPHLTVGENLGFGLTPHLRGSARRARIDAALADAGLAGFAARDPATLSGGERARVALLRTLLAEPCALLLDEPFGKLDQEARTRVREFVFARAREAGTPTLLVTHDPADAAAAAGRVIRLVPPAASATDTAIAGN